MPKDQDAEMGKALGVWMKRRNIRVVDLQKKMGWSYQYSWHVARGNQKFSRAAYGTFIMAFGVDAFREVARIAGVNLDKTEDR